VSAAQPKAWLATIPVAMARVFVSLASGSSGGNGRSTPRFLHLPDLVIEDLANASSIGLLALVVWRVSGRAFQLGFLLAVF
jgi:hypothetical protein